MERESWQDTHEAAAVTSEKHTEQGGELEGEGEERPLLGTAQTVYCCKWYIL